MISANELNFLLEENADMNSNNNSLNNKQTVVESYLNNSNKTKTYLLCLCLCLCNAADAVEIMCVGYIMSDISNLSSINKELLSASVFIGMLLGGIIIGYLSDKYGRRPCLLLSLGLNSFAGILSGFSIDINMLIILRLISGLGIGASVPIVFSLGAELFPALIRGKLLSIIASFWMMGALFVATAAWIMLGIPSIYCGWRFFAVICAIPAVIAYLMVYYYLPESPKFLINNNRNEEAINVLLYINNNNLLISSTYNILQSNDVEFNDLSVLKDNNNNEVNLNSVSDFKDTINLLISTDLFHSTTLPLLIIWFTLSFGSYGISTWISVLYEDLGIANPYRDDFIYALANLPGNIISILFIEKYGRKKLLCYGMVLAAFSSLGFGLASSNISIVVGCAAAFNCFSVIGWNSLDCMSCENFPTTIRTTAMGILAASGRFGAIFAQFVNGSLENNISLLLFVTSGCMIIGGFGSFYLKNDNSGEILN